MRAKNNFDTIFLVGFMGAGKSTIGQELARRLNWEFIDMDRVIEKEAKMSIADIFRIKGERIFRKLEAAVVAESEKVGRLKAASGRVIALGGGAVMRADNRRMIFRSERGVSIYLSACPRTLANRTAKQSAEGSHVRPLLATASGKTSGDKAGSSSRKQFEKIKKLLRQRRRFYRRADFEILTDSKKPGTVVDEITEIIQIRATLNFTGGRSA